MTARERELWDALKDAREALCGAMRVIAEIDTGSVVERLIPGSRSETYAQRFVDEMNAIGIQDGFGKRIDEVLLKYAPPTGGELRH
jgi:hypothetical protein